MLDARRVDARRVCVFRSNPITDFGFIRPPISVRGVSTSRKWPLHLVVSIDKLPVRYRDRHNGLLHKSIEEHSS